MIIIVVMFHTTSTFSFSYVRCLISITSFMYSNSIVSFAAF